MFLFLMTDPTDLIGLNFCSGRGEVVTAHRESLRIPVQLYSSLILLCEVEFELFFLIQERLKTVNKPEKNLNA